MTDYTKLDAAIIEAIELRRNPLYDRRVNSEAFAIEQVTDRYTERIIEGRLQALRKAGRIRHEKATINGVGGWRILDGGTSGGTE